MIIVFLGPPYSGKGTQAEKLGKKLQIPVFSMGDIIREAYKRGDPKAIEGFENYSMKGLHLPNDLKFPLLQEKLDNIKDFILDNYPATQEDLDKFLNYLYQKSLKLDKVFYVYISVEEMRKRMVGRGREDDKPEIVFKRRKQQDLDRIPVLEYFKSQEILEEINGESSREEINKKILDLLK